VFHRVTVLSVGKGCVYSFDPVGSYEREVYRAGGTAGAILQPLLDNQVGVLRLEQYEAWNPAPNTLAPDDLTTQYLYQL